jgi:hypothetical protein
MSDNYEFSKSEMKQDLNESTPFADVNYQWVSDINNGVYASSTGQTLVQFNLQNIYQSQKMIAPDSCFLLLPIQMAYQLIGTDVAGNLSVQDPRGDIVNASQTNNFPFWSLLSLKTGHHNLIHNCEIVNEDITVEQLMPFRNVDITHQLFSQMNKSDLEKYGFVMGYSDELDSVRSLRFGGDKISGNPVNNQNVGQNVLEGNGFVNNKIFNGLKGLSGTDPFTASNNADIVDEYSMVYSPLQNNNCINKAIQKRINKYAVYDGTNLYNQVNNLYGPPTGSYNTGGLNYIQEKESLNRVAQPFVTIDSANNVIFTDYVCIKMSTLFDYFRAQPLTRRFNAKINLYVNTGSCAVQVNYDTFGTPGQGNNGASILKSDCKPRYRFGYRAIQANIGVNPSNFEEVGAQSTFTNTCPYTVNYLGRLPSTYGANFGTDATIRTKVILTGLYIQKCQQVTLDGYNFNPSSQNAAIQSCRFYYKNVLLQADKIEKYIAENRKKEIVFKTVQFNQDANVGPGSYSKLISSSIKNPIGILIVPTIAKNLLGFSQFQSPFDTFPNTNNNISLINLNVTIGGVNVRNNLLDNNFSNWIEEVQTIDELVGPQDFGITNGLVDLKRWENCNRFYYITLSRSNLADKKLMRSLSVSFTNNSLCSIDLMFFIYYEKSCIVDCASGEIALVP